MTSLVDQPLVLKQLKVRKIALYPRLFSLLPPALASRFENQWSPVQLLAGLLGKLPAEALRFLASSPTGYLVISPEWLAYERGRQQVGKRRMENVAFISAGSLLGDGVEPLHVTAHLYDHLLGSLGVPDGPNLSDGEGVRPEWVETGRQIPRLFALGHNPDPFCRESPAEYFAQSVALYALRRRELNAADPLMYKLLSRTFFSDSFWKENRHAQ